MINAEITDEAGVARRVLMARFPHRAKIAIGTGVVTAIVLGLPLLYLFSLPVLPVYDAVEVGVAVLVLVLLFGWYLVLLFVTAWRGGFLALAENGVLIQTGLSSVLFPWSVIKAVVADTDHHKRASNAVLRLSIRSDANVPGWPLPAALSPALIGSSGRNLRILAWWFQPVGLNTMVATIRYLASHPEERHKLGVADPDAWLQASPAARRHSVDAAE